WLCAAAASRSEPAASSPCSCFRRRPSSSPIGCATSPKRAARRRCASRERCPVSRRAGRRSSRCGTTSCPSVRRPSSIGSYPTTPSLDALAAGGAVFAQAISQAPWTAASVGSLLTGVCPSVHGIDGGVEWHGRPRPGRLPFVTQRVLRPSTETLAERLHAYGYRTAGFVSNVYLNAVFGFGRGFDVYADDYADYSADVMTLKRRAEETNRRVLEWLGDHATEPFFLFVHYNDPHWPYDPPPPYGAVWTAGYAGPLTPADTGTVVESEGRPVRDLSPEDVAYLQALYDGEIAYADASLRVLLDAVRSCRLARPVLTIVTADHGEEFLDHGSTSHGYTLYDEQIHVPLVVQLPGRIRPSRIGAQVRLIDVPPTILELAGVGSRRGLQGTSLVPLMTGG